MGSWKYWKELPHRGDGKPKDTKPRKRYINLKKRRRETAKSVLLVIVLFTILFSGVVFSPDITYDVTIKLAAFFIILVFIVTLVVGIIVLNKFRKGYDVDISDESNNNRE